MLEFVFAQGLAKNDRPLAALYVEISYMSERLSFNNICYS